MVKFHIILHRVMCGVDVDHIVPTTCWVGVSVLQHGLVLNHPLGLSRAIVWFVRQVTTKND